MKRNELTKAAGAVLRALGLAATAFALVLLMTALLWACYYAGLPM